MERKTMFVSPEVHRRLLDEGRKGESFDDVLRRLLGLKPPKSADKERLSKEG